MFKKKNYLKEIVFKFYSKSEILFLEFYNLLKTQGFIIESIVGNEEYFTDFDIEKILEEDLIINLKNSSLHLTLNQHKEHNLYCSSYYFFYKKELIDVILDFIYNNPNNKLFYYAVLTNYYDVKWQDEKSIFNYKVNKKSLKGLSFSTDLWGEKCVDISKNYGRSIFKDGISYIAGYCSWFGDIIDEDVFNGIDFVIYKTKLQNGLIEIKLFKDLNGNYFNYRERQKKILHLLKVI